MNSSVSRKCGLILAFITSTVLNLIVAFAFYDRAWVPTDDGHYAHVADRLNKGQILSRDIEELHPGYVHFIHAVALSTFGRDLQSLHIAFAVNACLQGLLIFLLIAQTHPWRGVLASFTFISIGTFQISTPTPSLYALTTTVLIICVLQWSDAKSRWRLVTLGLLIGTAFFFRQLTGVFLTIAVVTYLLLEQHSLESHQGANVDSESDHLQKLPARLASYLSKAVLALMLVGLTAYCVRSTDITAFLLFSLWPIGILVLALSRACCAPRYVVAVAIQLGAGFFIAAIPLLLYHFTHQSILVWLNDSLLRALKVQGLAHIQLSRYANYMGLAAENIAAMKSAREVINGLYWLLLPSLNVILGVVSLRELWRCEVRINSRWALPLVALFYSQVSIFNQIPLYLYLSAGMTLTTLYLCAAETPYRRLATVIALAVASVGLYFHAGQPHTRNPLQFVGGERHSLVKSELERCKLFIPSDHKQTYRQLTELTSQIVNDKEEIFVFPNNAELYMLCDRPNPFRLFNPTLSLTNDNELRSFQRQLAQSNVELVIHNRNSVYNTDRTLKLLDTVNQHFYEFEQVGGFVVFLRRK